MLLTNYITSAWRNILRHKLFSIINILGLAIGLAAVMLITLFVRDEISYDTFWDNADNIYRLQMTFTLPGDDPDPSVSTTGPMIHAMKKEFPQIEFATRIRMIKPSISLHDRSFSDYIQLVDPAITDVLKFTVISGDFRQAINDANSIVLTQSQAIKYFGQDDPMGQILSIDLELFKRDFKVAAVIEDLPNNSELSFITAMIAIQNRKPCPWCHNQNRDCYRHLMPYRQGRMLCPS